MTYGYDSATQTYTADYTITVSTTGGLDDGTDGSVTVQLTIRGPGRLAAAAPRRRRSCIRW